MEEQSFDKKAWEENIYSKGKQLNLYPFDLLVSVVFKKFLNVPFEERKNTKVLDLGCGAGNNTKFLAENGLDVYALDGSESVINVCKQRFSDWNLKADFVCGDFLDLPYNDDFFDLIIDRESMCANNFNHIEKIVEGVHKKLKKGGIFISFFYSSFHPDKEYGKEIEPNTYDEFTGGCFYEASKIHFLDLKEIQSLYKDFTIENVMRHSLLEVFDKKGRFMEFDEYIIIVRK